MSREELITKIAQDAEITKKQAQTVLNSVLSNITDALVKGEKVSFVGFGSFAVSDRQERQGVNPRTKEKITIPARKVPVFKAGKQLKEAVAK